jgi:glycosyltransferase involved in cell wall biosynthesis
VSEAGRRPVVIVVVGNYLPGFKAGGIVRAVVNTIDHLSGDIDFKVITRDRDLGDVAPYPNVRLNAWQPMGGADVYYLSPDRQSAGSLARLVNNTPHDAIWLNSFFDPLTVKLLWQRRIGAANLRRPIVAPRGEFAWASLQQKYPKKLVFMWVARAIRLYAGLIWHASSQLEAADIRKEMHVSEGAIHYAPDFAIKSPGIASPANSELPPPAEGDSVRLVFISRVAREKNLDFALRVLKKVRANVVFDIYGPTADEAYWRECQALIAELPPHVTVNYRGIVGGGDVVTTFAQYELFLFPSGGEAFGHVIAESLVAGTPVLTSTETAFHDLAADGLGWDFDLRREEAFVATIDQFAANRATRPSRAAVQAAAAKRLADPVVERTQKSLLLGASA